MLDFRTLYGQHQAIIRLASDLTGLADKLRTRDDAIEARALLERLDRVLSAHLELEDRAVMPALSDSEDSATRALALDCIEEMGGIAQVWAAYRSAWQTETIAAAPARFACATRNLVEALAGRVEREERQLYPLAQGLENRPA